MTAPAMAAPPPPAAAAMRPPKAAPPKAPMDVLGFSCMVSQPVAPPTSRRIPDIIGRRERHTPHLSFLKTARAPEQARIVAYSPAAPLPPRPRGPRADRAHRATRPPGS